MGINRPTNLNIRDVPGNGSIVGFSTSPLCVESTTVCESCYNTCDACGFQASLGCTSTFCGCPCCDVVCGCDCTVCDRTIPSGMWKTSEQYEAKERDAWGDDTSSSGAETCLCNINSGFTCCSNIASVGGNIICKGGNCLYVLAPASAEVTRDWYNRNDAITVAQSVTGCTGWFIPSGTISGELRTVVRACQTYAEDIKSYAPEYTYNSKYWSDTEHSGSCAWGQCMSFDYWQVTPKNSSVFVRAARCVSY